MCFSSDGLRLVSVSDDKSLILYKIDSQEPEFIVKNAHHDKIKSTTYLSKELIATGAYDSTVKIWDPKTQKVKQIISQPILTSIKSK